MHSLISAIILLTRLPMPKLTHTNKNIAWVYPVVGLILGLIYWFLIFALTFIPFNMSIEILAIAIITIMIFITGGFHLDGIADVTDGFWGGDNKAKRLKIMCDSRIGAYGTTAIVCVILLYYSIFISIDDPFVIMYNLVVSSIVSRAVMAIIQLTNPPAKTTGLLTSVADKKQFPIVLIQILFIISFTGTTVFYVFDENIVLTVFIASFVIWLLLSLLFRKKIGGITGDCLGASQIISEITILIILYGVSYV